MKAALLRVAALLALSAPAMAADISPGLWEITMETRVASAPGFAPAPFHLTQCFTAEDARDPEKAIARVANPGATDCTYTEKNYSGSTLDFAMQCAGTFAIQSRGRISFSSDSMDGTIDSKANVGGGVVDTQNRVSARRVGGC